jgi:hypothetical protein
MSQTERRKFSRGLDKLFTTPSLMNGEDEVVFAELYARVEECVQPKDVWDQMLVSDLVNHFWEQQRYRRCTGAIIDSARRTALLKILHDRVGLNPDDATDVADIYFGVVRYEEEFRQVFHSDPAKIPKTRKGVIILLEKHGFTETDIDRVAIEASVEPLTAIENLALKHELRRDTILCELERRRERRDRQRFSAPTRQINGGGRELGDGLTGASSPT